MKKLKFEIENVENFPGDWHFCLLKLGRVYNNLGILLNYTQNTYAASRQVPLKAPSIIPAPNPVQVWEHAYQREVGVSSLDVPDTGYSKMSNVRGSICPHQKTHCSPNPQYL